VHPDTVGRSRGWRCLTPPPLCNFVFPLAWPGRNHSSRYFLQSEHAFTLAISDGGGGGTRSRESGMVHPDTDGRSRGRRCLTPPPPTDVVFCYWPGRAETCSLLFLHLSLMCCTYSSKSQKTYSIRQEVYQKHLRRFRLISEVYKNIWADRRRGEVYKQNTWAPSQPASHPASQPAIGIPQ